MIGIRGKKKTEGSVNLGLPNYKVLKRQFTQITWSKKQRVSEMWDVELKVITQQLKQHFKIVAATIQYRIMIYRIIPFHLVSQRNI